MTTATYGRTSPTPFVCWDPDSSCWKTYAVTSLWGSETFSETWPHSGSMRNGACYEQPMSGSATTEHDCSSLLPTPTAADGERGPDYARATREGSGGDDLVTTMHRLLPDADRDGRGAVVGMEPGMGPRCDADGRVPLIEWGAYDDAIRRHERVVGRAHPAPLAGRAVSARFVEWMMALPDGWVTDLASNRHALRLLGNAVVPMQAEAALRALLARMEVI